MKTLPYSVERTMLIEADPEIVFGFFTDPARWAMWWGAGSTIDARPGGALLICHSNGLESVGEVLDVKPHDRIVFTMSLHAHVPVPPEDSRVTFRLETRGEGTLVHVTHELADASVRDLMPQGWRFHLSRFANAVADAVHADAPRLVETWFALWSQPDEPMRRQALESIAQPGLKFRDRFSTLDSLDEVLIHIGAAQRFMPGVRLERRSEVRHCQGTALADWVLLVGDGKERMRGTSVFTLGRDGRIASIVGVTSQGA